MGVVLLTGGSRGIDAATARLLAARSDAVVLGSLRALLDVASGR